MPDTTTDETDETADEPDRETITLEFEIELDEIHAPAWERVLAAAPDRDSARATVASRCEFAVGPKAAIYQQHRLIEQQQEQVAQGMMPPAEEDDGNTS